MSLGRKGESRLLDGTVVPRNNEALMQENRIQVYEALCNAETLVEEYQLIVISKQ